jgi:hypothetical protein
MGDAWLTRYHQDGTSAAKPFNSPNEGQQHLASAPFVAARRATGVDDYASGIAAPEFYNATARNWQNDISQRSAFTPRTQL